MKLRVAGVLAGAMVLASLQAFAASAQDGMWGVGINGGFNTHSMSDVNNLVTTYPGGNALNSGEQLGIDVRYRIADNWVAGIEGNYLFADQSSNLTGGSTLTENLNAMEYLINGSYVFPDVATGLDLRVGIAAGMAMLSGATFGGSVQGNNTTSLTGSGFDGKIFLGADYYFMPTLSLGLDLGYRYAKFSPITATTNGNSVTALNKDGSDLSVDYSGLDVQLALTWWL
jgi:hypothetical protein